MRKAKAASPRRTRASRENSARKAAQARGLGITRRGDLGEVAFVHKAMSLGYVVAKPYGQMHRYDFMVEGGNKLWRVQVKTSTCMRDGRYQLCVQRITHRRTVAYKKSELDFVVAYLMPVKTWYILPISVVAGRRSFLLAPPDSAARTCGPNTWKPGTSWANRMAPLNPCIADTPSRGATQECSPRRKPWESGENNKPQRGERLFRQNRDLIRFNFHSAPA